MTHRWTWQHVEDRMIAAESTLRRLPEVTFHQIHSNLPDVVRAYGESYGYIKTRIRVAPSARDIDQMRKTLSWLLWLEPVDRRIVWGCAEMKRWERLAGENGMSQRDAQLAWLCLGGRAGAPALARGRIRFFG